MASMAANGSKRSLVPPRKISVQKFAESRGSELEALHSIVSNRLNDDFRSQRNKRRRTTSYENQVAKKCCRRKRKFGFFGKINSSTSDKEQKKTPRRARRRNELKRNPEIGFVASGDGTKRLRTHVWHAKRFTMTKRWGFHLPLGLQGRGRGSRAVLKWFKDGAVVHDASYYAAVQLEGTEDSLMSILRMVLVPCPSAQSEDVSNSTLSGGVYGTAMLHQIGAPGSKLIAPVTYMWRPPHFLNRENGVPNHIPDGVYEPQSSESCSSHRQLWVWIHASAFCEGYDTLKFVCQKQANDSGLLVNCFSLEGQVAKLELMGSKAFQLLQKALHPVLCDSESSLQLKNCSVVEIDHGSLFKKSSVLKNEDSIYSRSVLSLTVMDPRVLPDSRTEGVSVSAPTGALDNKPEEPVKAAVSVPVISEETKLLLTSLSKCEENSCFYDNKDIWDVHSGVCPPFEENVLCLEKHHLRMNFICLDDPQLGRLKTSSAWKGSIACPILLLKNNNQAGTFLGWSMILPLSWVKVFWNSLVSKGAHAIGLREKQWISCEVGLPLFPLDFPDCNAYSSFMETECSVLDQRAEQLPPAVRAFKIPIPPPWDSVCVTLGKESTTLVENQVSCEDVCDSNSLSNSKCGDLGMNQPNGDGNSFNGIVARTSAVLTDFLNEIHGNHLLLFPQVPNRKTTSFLKFMKDESRVGQAYNGGNQIMSDRKLCFVRVLLRAYKEGVFEEGAVVCAPSLGDISLWTSRSGNSDGGLQISDSSVRLYFEEQFSGKWQLRIPQDTTVGGSHRWPIGFVTTGFVRGSKKPVAQALCEAHLLARLREGQWNEMPVKRRRKEIYVVVRNLRSSAYRLAHAAIVLEQQVEDVEFL